MIISTVKEIKAGENRVGLAPEGVKKLTSEGNKVLVERGAGIGSGFSDKDYEAAGAEMCSVEKAWAKTEMVVKVKEPLHSEFKYLREGLIVFTYLHLAAEPELTRELLKNKTTGIAYETVEVKGKKILLTPMSEVAGRMSVQVGMHFLERTNGGSGKLLAGVSGVEPGTVTILGSGVAGSNAARIAHGVGANTIVIGISENELKELERKMPGLKTLMSTKENIENSVTKSDLVVGTVAITGASAPKLVTREMVKKMKPGSVVVDISIDQGGSFETSRPTSHSSPTYVEEGIIHYCVTNMPGAVPNTSTKALTNTTLPYILEISKGFELSMESNPDLAKGINTYKGKLTSEPVAKALGLKFEPSGF